MWFDAFSRFASLFGAEATVGKLIRLNSVVYPPLYIAWRFGDPAFLTDTDALTGTKTKPTP